MKFGGWFGAAIIIFGTTVDDTVWLVPFVTSPSLSATSKLCHALLFIATLQALTLLCVLLASGIQVALPILGFKNEHNEEHILTCISAIFCWVIAGFFYLKKLLKRRAVVNAVSLSGSNDEERPLSSNHQENYTKLSDTNTSHGLNEREADISFSPLTVVTLTTIGALDELSYFPSLLTGHIFYPRQLLVGALVASVVILAVVFAFLSKCKPLLDFLDRIPLYGIVAMFALILTVQSFII
jgi:hypothetical protein